MGFVERFIADFLLVFASALASIILYNEIFLKPAVKYLKANPTVTQAPLFFYPTITKWIIVMVILLIGSLAFRKMAEK